MHGYTIEMKELNGQEIVDFVKQRQLRVSRSLRQASQATPKLAIIRTNPNPVVDTYMKLKKQYGEDIEAIVEVVDIDQSEAIAEINKLNKDDSVKGIIVQLPLVDIKDTDKILATVDPSKDVDGLAPETKFTPPTVVAIDWLLVGHNINLLGKKIVIVGKGRLVGAPLLKYWLTSGLDVSAIDENTKDLKLALKDADVIVSATGQAGLIKSDMVKTAAIVVDAGVSTGTNGLVGDVDDDVRVRSDIQITPKKGGVGPLTISALFENLLIATGQQAKNT